MVDALPSRSLLYVPAIRAGAVAKARSLPCDAVILDLEDAVAPDMKDAARVAAAAAIAADWGSTTAAIRVNGLGTPWADDDYAALRAARPAVVVVPKIDGPGDAAAAVALSDGIPLWAMIETPRAVLAAAAIAATPGVTALVAGFADLANDLRLRIEPGRAPLQFSMSAIVLAARAAGIFAFDGIYPDISDAAGCRAEAEQALIFGFDGKTVIHPRQIDLVNAVFTPGEAEIANAHGLIAAYEAALADGRGVTTYAGRLVEALHVETARRLIALAARASVSDTRPAR